MTDHDLAPLLRRALAPAPGQAPDFASIAARAPRRRLRGVRAGLVALVLVAAIAAPLALRRATPEPTAVALAETPTTDWLLETPDPDWLASLDDPTKETP